MKRTLAATFLVLAPALWTAPPNGQEASPEASGPVVRELAGIQRALEDLVGLLESMRHKQDIDLVLRRIELHERRLAPLERSLRSNEQDQINVKQAISEMEMWKSNNEEQLEEVERQGIEDELEDYRQQILHAEKEIASLQLRLEAFQRRQIELENTLYDGRDEIEILDELLREMLE